MIWLSLMFATMVFVQAIRSKKTLTAAYYEGYRAAVRDSARAIEKVSQDTFDEHLQYGSIIEPLKLTSLLGEAKDRVKELAQRIGRPL